MSGIAAPAQTPGTLDPSFGAGGTVQTDVGTEDRGNAIVLQPDGKVVVAGKTRLGAVRFDFALVRYNVDGSLDTTFGNLGKVVTSLGFSGGTDDEALAIALQPDGKLIAVGDARGSSGAFFRTGVVRYNPDGSLDTTFGAGGIVLLDRAADRALALQPDGKIVLGGGGGTSLQSDGKVARLNYDGSLDTGFGSGGVVVIDFAGSGDGVWGVAVQPDGKIVAAGNTSLPGDDANFAVVRLNPDGSFDNTFGVGGKVATDFDGLTDIGYSVTLQPDAKIIVAGQARTGTNEWDFGLVRYNTDGSVDTTFGVNGRVRTPFGGWDAAFAVKLQPNGKIVAAGTIGGQGFAVARYNPDGSLDASFAGGKATVHFKVTDESRGLVIQPDGKIVLAGTADGGAEIGDFALARFFGEPFTGSTGSISGRVLTAAGTPLRSGTISIAEATSGIVRYASINPFGFYRFTDLPLGGRQVMSARSKRNSVIAPQVLVNGDVTVDLRAEP